MNFSDRYIKLPVKLYNRKEGEKAESLGIEDNHDYTKSIIKINPLKIICYYATPEMTDSDDPIYTCVDMEGNHSAVICLSIEEFEKRMNAF